METKFEYNYHTHTPRCGHASGSEREYIEEAIKGGLKALGFSDHTCMPYEEVHHSDIRMRMAELENYCDTLTALKKEYEKDITLHIGLEVEYYPLYFHKLVDFVKDYPVEYMILGQHSTNNDYDGMYVANNKDDDEVVRQYARQVVTAMDEGKFLYVAHPDIARNPGNDALYRECMNKICVTAKAHDLPLEINFLGIWDHRHYPNPILWEEAGKVGNKVIFGADAHTPDRVQNQAAFDAAMEMVKKYGLQYVHSLEDRF